MLQAVFTDNTNCIKVSGLTQWDYGQKLEITLAGLLESFEAHFAYRGATEAPVVKGTAVDGVATVPIPNILTTQKNEAVCWLYYKDGESGETVKTILLPIKPRQKPTDYVYTETEVVSYTSLLKRVEELENNGASDDAIASAVAKWLEENPIESDTSDAVQYIAQTLAEEQQTQARTNIGAASAKEVGQLSEEIVDLKNNGTSGTGWTTEQIEILDSIGDHINFLDTEGGRLWDALIASLTNNQGTTKVLTSITAVYSGGSVEAGTQTSDLKITVTATYDDGTSKTVIGYTTSPSTILEGENTVTVTYNGKTSTFDVVGIVTPAEVTLESISAVFNGENAQAGTNASDLDITVTGHYSDGSTKTETEWTTAGIVSEGENVFTIYLDDKTCTVSVVGVAVEEDVEVGAGTKIARFEGQTSENGYGTATIDSTLIENNKIYAFVLDKNTTVSAYNRIILFGFFLKTINGTLKIMAPSYNFDGASCNISESEGVITFAGTNMNKFHKGTFYDLYEVGNDDQVVTDGQLFDYIGTIEPTKNDGFENTLTIPASAFTEDGYFAVILKSYNTEYSYTSGATYARTLNAIFGYHGEKYVRYTTAGVNSAMFDIAKKDDGSFDIVGESSVRIYPESNLVYDVYRAKPIWG